MLADQLLDSIKRETSLPASQLRLSDSDLLALADEETQGRILPMLVTLRAEYLVTLTETALVSGQASYAIPYRAIGRSLRDVKLTQGGSTRSLPYIAPEDSHAAALPGMGFFLRGDKLVLTPTPTESGTLELHYEVRPSRLVVAADCARVASVGASSVVVDSVPAGIVSGTVCDVVQARSGHALLGMDVPVTNVAGTTLTLAVPDGLAVGDYICVAEQTPVIQLPEELHQVLAQAVSVRVMESIGDMEMAQLLLQRLQEKMTAARTMLTPRVRGEAQVILNPSGLLSRQRGARRWR